MIIPWKYNDYLSMDPDTQKFTQRMLLHEYMEASELFDERSLLEIFMEDMYFHEEEEQYETCQLYKDTFIRFKTQITEY